MRSTNRFLVLLLVFAVVGMTATAAFATKLQHRNLDQMTKLSQRIFVGTCVAVEQAEQPLGSNVVPLTRYTFQVQETIKGGTGVTETVQQFGKMEGLGAVIGMPRYQEGGKYLLFLLPESEIGLTSPVGLFQGAFQIAEDPETGEVQATNGYNNLGLFKDMESGAGVLGLAAEERALMSTVKGAVDYDQFIGLVKKMAK